MRAHARDRETLLCILHSKHSCGRRSAAPLCTRALNRALTLQQKISKPIQDQHRNHCHEGCEPAELAEHHSVARHVRPVTAK